MAKAKKVSPHAALIAKLRQVRPARVHIALSREKVDQIRIAYWVQGKLPKLIAKSFDISSAMVSSIVVGNSYAHLPFPAAVLALVSEKPSAPPTQKARA